MTPLPKRRHSTRRGGKREAAISKSIPILQKCPKCGSAKISHQACRNCGYYGDIQIILPKKPKDKK
ncbi:50S ribosomal protein L32 [Candidatus Gottesmanbacteria bacterium]|nr:50S ribosomal protein L32 [Candidatus Gottesmanbacteria bacterium]